MKQHDPIISLYIKFLYSTIVGIVLISVVIGLFTVYPFYTNLTQEEDKDFYRFGESIKNHIEQYFSEATNLALQVTSRTVIRNLLVDYNNHDISLEELQKLTNNKLEDVLQRNKTILGITRFDKYGNKVISIGEPLSSRLLTSIKLSNLKVSYYEEHTERGVPYLVVDAPILNRQNEKVGNDVVLFNEYTIQSILDTSSKNYGGANILLKYADEGWVHKLHHSSQKHLADIHRVQISNVFQIANTPFSIKVTIDKDTLYAMPNKELVRLILIVAIILLLGCFAVYMFSRKLIGFAEKEIQRRKEKEQELRHHKEQLEERVNVELQKRLRSEKLVIYQSKLAAMGELMTQIQHHWRQPLNTFILMLEIFEEALHEGNTSKDTMLQHIGKAKNTIYKMSELITSFSRYFQSDTEQESFSLKHIIQETIDFFQADLDNQDVKISVDVEVDTTVNGIKKDYGYACLILLNNARDALVQKSVKDKQIRIRIFKTEENRSSVTFSDNAGGINVEHAEKIFEPYFTTKFPSVGTGMGLFVAKNIIEGEFGGNITFINTDEGAMFTILL